MQSRQRGTQVVHALGLHHAPYLECRDLVVLGHHQYHVSAQQQVRHEVRVWLVVGQVLLRGPGHHHCRHVQLGLLLLVQLVFLVGQLCGGQGVVVDVVVRVVGGICARGRGAKRGDVGALLLAPQQYCDHSILRGHCHEAVGVGRDPQVARVVQRVAPQPHHRRRVHRLVGEPPELHQAICASHADLGRVCGVEGDMVRHLLAVDGLEDLPLPRVENHHSRGRDVGAHCHVLVVVRKAHALTLKRCSGAQTLCVLVRDQSWWSVFTPQVLDLVYEYVYGV
mmetsp:Transcript_21337/g.48301  ORF Transcript_21337/g.48301 Transcript_21337/m.48301 type:complete len:280 (+) Transcript_21337:1328-2167(+)